MNILQVCPRYYPAIGGVEEHVRNISERLAKQHRVTVFASDLTGKLPKEEVINGVLVRRFKSFSPGDAYHISLEMLTALRKSQFEIVHGHNYHAFPLFFASYARARKFVVNPYYHGHGHTPVRDFLLKLYRSTSKKIFTSADAIIAVSRYEKDILAKDLSIDRGKISVIPPGIDSAEFVSLNGTRRETKIILYVGRLEEYKGVQYIIEALPLLDKQFRFDIVGKGPYKERLVEMTGRLGLTDRVSFYQDLPREELLKMYARAGVFMLLSQHESFSIVVAEALAAKTPCIVANTSALSEWVDNRNCFGVDYPIKAGRLAELISRVAGAKVGDIKLWGWDEVAQQISGVYGF